MPRFTAKESLAQLQQESDESTSDIDLEPIQSKQPLKQAAKGAVAHHNNDRGKYLVELLLEYDPPKTKPAPANGKRKPRDRLLDECDADESEEGQDDHHTRTKGNNEEPTASATSRVSYEDGNLARRRSNVSPMQMEKGAAQADDSDESEEWPSINVRKSLKFDGSPTRSSQAPSQEKTGSKPAIEDETVADDGEQSDDEMPEKVLDGPDTDRDVYMSQAQVEAVLEGIEDPWRERKEILMNRYVKLFPQWHSLLRLDMNVILYGVGSKKSLLQRFLAETLQDEYSWEIHGYKPRFDLEENLRNFCEKIAEVDLVPSETEEMLLVIRKFAEECEGLNILVHNIDGPNLRNSKSQELFSRLAAIPHVHMLASLDHPNLPLLWSQEVVGRFKWVYFETSTLTHYDEFPIPDLTFSEAKSASLALSSLRTVFQSLTSNARKIYGEIAQYQTEEDDPDDDRPPRKRGILYKQLYRKCVGRLLISSDGMLRKQLVEFYDHDLLRSEKDHEGNEYLRIPATEDVLKKFLEVK